MPVEYLILPDLDVTYVKYYGHVNTSQIALAFDVHRSDENFRPGRNEFADLSSVKMLDMDFDGVESHFDQMVEKYKENGAVTFTAIYAPQPELTSLAYAYAKLSQTSDLLDAKVYEDAGDALLALEIGIPANEFFRSIEDDQA